MGEKGKEMANEEVYFSFINLARIFKMSNPRIESRVQRHRKVERKAVDVDVTES